MEIKEIIREAARKGLCKEWQRDMKNSPTLSTLCDMYFRGDDWAMRKDFPSLEILREFKAQTQEYGLYTDFEGNISNVMRTALFGNSKAEITYSDFAVATLIVRHNSKAEITTKGNAFLLVNVLDNAEVEIQCTEDSNVAVYLYSDKAKIQTTGDLKIIKKQLNGNG
ncbi:hypothetical protein [Riemerella columbipharyngis]|uniref:Uncharacterized protein n=1 Tax=Riemerella columbipharyngis TaxID=1071918 RepID=A0A1G7AL26_9FLAO|nr:hypothetical protein [Riemerella columbipharyngis]SDE15177.1 hypothetical protein SAMN05421544_1043 [Riemerella columbipharyngis]